MYKIIADNTTFCDSRVEDLAVYNAKVNLQANKAGTFNFTVPPCHPYYNLIVKRKTMISVYRDEETEPVFAGVAVSIEDDFYKQRVITCEGELTFLNETIQRPYRYQGVTVRGLLEALITKHNAECDVNERFVVGSVTVTDPNNYISCYTNYDTTMKCLQEDLVNDLGGYIRIRHTNNTRYIDYLAESPNTCAQTIELGKNLIDYKSTLNTSDIVTVLIPLGTTLDTQEIEGLDARLTVKSVNDNKDYIESEGAVATYGRITQKIVFDNITTASALLTKGQKYLSETQFENMVIEAKAVDLHMIRSDVDSFKILDTIRVISAPHGLNKNFVLTEMEIDLNNPERNTITLGSSGNLSLTAKSQTANSEALKRIDEIQPASILESAKSNATEMLTTAQNGYVTTITDADGHPKEILILDTPTLETATKIWRWNQNGLGYSNNGGQSYGLAMTQDGSIVADYITSGTISADRIKATVIGAINNATGSVKISASKLNLEGYITATNLSTAGQTTINGGNITTGSLSADRISGGTLKVGGNNNANGVIEIYNASNTKIGTWNKDGIDATGVFKTTTDAGTYTTLVGNGVNMYDSDNVHVGKTGGATVNSKALYGIGTNYNRSAGAFIGAFNPSTGQWLPAYIQNFGVNANNFTERHLFFNGAMRVASSDGIYVGTNDVRIKPITYADANGLGIYNSCYVYGSLGCSGTKYRVVDTDDYGKIGMNAMESAEAYFSDLGTVTCDKDGIAEVVLDPKYLETVDISKPYMVQITQLSAHTGYVEKLDDKFIIHSEKGAKFDWICYHKQKGFSDVRMEEIKITEPVEEDKNE